MDNKETALLNSPPAAPAIRRALPSDARREGGGQRWMILVYAALHLLPFVAIWSGATLIDAIVAVVLLMGRGLCFSAGYHRLLAHNSFRTYRVLRFLLAAGACAALRGGPLWWVALHRWHHRFPDTDVDIHPAKAGPWWGYAGWILSGRFVHTDYKQVKDLARYPELCWLNRWPLVPPAVLALACFLIGGWGTLAIGFGLSTVLLWHSLCMMDALDHRFGWRRYATPDHSRNSMTLAVLAMGEGWHNDHHHYPRSARFGFYWWESDSTFLALVIAARLGLVWDVRTPTPEILARNQVSDTGNRQGPREAPSA